MAAVDAREPGTPDAPPPVRPDLVPCTGYHSAQVEVEVRLNTNESPLPPPPEWLEAFRAGLADVDFNRYPDREATELRRALADSHGVRPDQVFCANGSNEVLQSLLLAYGGPGRSVALFEPTYTLHRHIARITGTAVAAGARTDEFPSTSTRWTGWSTPTDPVITFLCSPNNPTGRAEPLEQIRGGRGDRPGPGGGGRGLRAVRPVLGPRPGASGRARLRARGRGADLLQDLVDGRAAARVPDRPARGGRRPARWWRCRTTSTRPSSWPDAWPSQLRRRDGDHGWP